MTTFSIPSGGTIAIPSATSIRAVATAPGLLASAEADANYTIQTSSTALFPRFGVQCFLGNQIPNTTQLFNLIARYPWILLGNNFPGGIPDNGFTRDQIVTGIKSQPLTGLNAVRSMVFQYDDMSGTSYGTQIHPELGAVVVANNWYIYLKGSSGQYTWTDPNYGVSTYNIHAHGGGGGGVQAVAQDPATGLWPYEWGAKYFRDRYIAGGGLATSTNFSQFGSANLDGMYCDNMTPYPRVSADWDRSNVTESSLSGSPNSATLPPKIIVGLTDAARKWRALEAAAGTSRYIIGNTSYAYGLLGLGLPVSTLAGIFDFPMMQYQWGQQTYAQMIWGNAYGVMQYYKAQQASARNGACTITGSYAPTDYASMRQAQCQTLMDNGYHIAGCYGPPYTADGIQGGDATMASWPLIDEFWGGTLRTGGFLGVALGTAQGQPQNSPWQGNVYRRDFTGGIALINMGTTPQTITLEKTYYHIKSVYGNQSINSGLATTGFTLGTFTYPTTSKQVGDACILLNAQPPSS